MYNVLTGSKDVGYYRGVLSFFRKYIENFIIYGGSILTHQKADLRKISKLEQISVINLGLVLLEGNILYNSAIFIGGLLACLLGQGSDSDDEDEYFLHWFLWTAYDLAGSLYNDTFVSSPLGDTVIDIFRNISVVVVALDKIK